MVGITEHPLLSSIGVDKVSRENIKKDLGMVKKCMAMPLGIATVISWIPIIGAIIGALRLNAARKMLGAMPSNMPEEGKKFMRQFAYSMIARGVLEILTFGAIGPLLLVADLSMTVARKCINKSVTANQT